MKLSELGEQQPAKLKLSDVAATPVKPKPPVPESGAAFGVYPKAMEMKQKPDIRPGGGIGMMARGIPANIIGIPGDIGSLAHSLTGTKDLGILPTSEDVAKKLGAKTPKDLEAASVGGLLSPFAPAMLKQGGKVAGQGIKAGLKQALGEVSPTKAAYAKELEDKGIRLSPTQVRENVPVSEKGATLNAKHNQEIVNKEVSKLAGKEAPYVDQNYLRDRYKDLGSKYDSIYKGREFKMDGDAVEAIKMISERESAMGSLAAKKLKTIADEIKNAHRILTSSGKSVPDSFQVRGELMQRIQTALREEAQRGGPDASFYREMKDAINDSILRNHKDIASDLSKVNSEYAATSSLNELMQNGGIHGGNVSLERLGDMLKARKGAVKRAEYSPIYKLGEAGSEMGLKAIWELSGKGATGEGLSQLINKGLDFVGNLGMMKSRPARAIQRAVNEAPKIPPETPATSLVKQ
jgi:hypothetical protein